jgi:hypothetical protein
LLVRVYLVISHMYFVLACEYLQLNLIGPLPPQLGQS